MQADSLNLLPTCMLVFLSKTNLGAVNPARLAFFNLEEVAK